MGIQIHWNLYKPTGKWAHGGEVEISGEHQLWDAQLLQEIDDLQDQIVKGIISGRRSYILVIAETKEQAAKRDYHGFYTHLFQPTEEEY